MSDEDIIVLNQMTEFLIEKMIEYQSVDFFFDKIYRPLPRVVTEEELDQMTDAEFDVYEEELVFHMTLDQRIESSIAQFATLIIERDFKEADWSAPSMKEKFITHLLNLRKQEETGQENFDEDFEVLYKEISLKVLDRYIEENH